jgi:hypothetical protein
MATRFKILAMSSVIQEHPCRIFAVQANFGEISGAKLLKSLALPRGLHEVNVVNGLRESGTLNRSMTFQDFSGRVSHYAERDVDACADLWGGPRDLRNKIRPPPPQGRR